jgi:L-amino acid N-acyltransferase YncA
MVDGIVVRDLLPGDFEGVRLVDELTQKAYHGNGWERYSDSEKERFLKSRKSEFRVNCETRYSFVAAKKEEIVGFLFAHENLPFGDEVVARHIAVHPNFQEQGVGKKLFFTLISKAKEDRKKAIRSSINPDNPASIILHERCGFEVVDWKRAVLRL